MAKGGHQGGAKKWGSFGNVPQLPYGFLYYKQTLTHSIIILIVQADVIVFCGYDSHVRKCDGGGGKYLL